LRGEGPAPRPAPKKRGSPPAKTGSNSVRAGSAKQPASAPEPAGPTQLPWGHAGSVNLKGALTDRTGRPGVIRLVGAGVYYDQPPLDRNIWQAALEQHGRYEMVWTEGDPAQVRPASEMRNEFRDRPPLIDRIADSL